MNDLINRRKAFEYFVALWECIGTIMDRDEWEDVCMTTANEIPPAQPERKKGQWINAYPDIEPNPMFMYGICSVCGYEQAISNKLNFCPNCGSYMGEKKNV